jgi:hypothetical protein
MNIRRPIYESVSAFTVSTDSATPTQVAGQIADILIARQELTS